MNFMQNVFPVAYGGNSMAFNYVTTEAELIGVQSRLICEFASSSKLRHRWTLRRLPPAGQSQLHPHLPLL